MIVYCKGWFLLCVLLNALNWGGTRICAEDSPKDGRVRLHVKASDPNGGKLTFKWEQTSGPVAKIIDAAAAVYDDNSRKWRGRNFIPTKPGTYTFRDG